MRRIGGISGLQREAQKREEFKRAGQAIANQQLETALAHMESFKSNLEEFALKYRQEIQKNPVFRNQFHKLCTKIGVDPLASNKGIWSELLGVGDFYYELGIQIVEICLATKNSNGGLISTKQLLEQLKTTRKNSTTEITEDDIQSSIKSLQVLGHCYQIVTINGDMYLQSTSRELNEDASIVLKIVQDKSSFTIQELIEALSWNIQRCQNAAVEFFTLDYL